MHEFIIVRDIVVILLAALPIIFLFKKINLPSIVGFLIAGMIIGPFGFNLIRSIDEVSVMAEIGVMILMFTIGLEVSFSQLVKIKKFLIVAGGLQFILTVLFGALIFFFLNIDIRLSIFYGLLLSLSSTSIVLKIFSDRNEFETIQGKISLGILVFQDLAVVPVFLLIPLLGSQKGITWEEIIIKLLVAFGSIAIILFLAKLLMPKIVHQIARLRLREVFTVGIILLLLGTAYLTYSLGLSFAMGAFVAGLILAESDYNHQILSEIIPFKDAFNSIFFVSIGLLLNISFVVNNPLLISVFALGIILIKSAIIISIVLFIKYPFRIAVLTGLALAQVGEFSFVLAQTGSNYSLLNTDAYNIFLASTIFTMILTPFIIKASSRLSIYSKNIDNSSGDNLYQEKLSAHVIIAGFGLNGRNLARVLKETGIPYIAAELNPDTVKTEKAKGERIMYGDISKEAILRSVSVEKANIIVFAVSDPAITKSSLSLAKKINPKIYALVRTRYINEVDELKKLGADEVIPEEFETALQIFRKVLEKYHIPLNVIMQQTTLLRQESYKLLRKEGADISSFVHLDEILAQGLTESFFVNNENKFIGKSISEINLRAETEATIIAIVRSGKTISNPSGKEILKAADTLVIYGTHQSVDKAIDKLS